ncbi:hypothetical protein EV384_4076 [Micromonospora kangleipakensis]|uniref:Uncharacterized protein n=1 Tax=Micromonospora kangleipakensis TaxID=1077942 RepID=A0A4Q8BEG7_9ACTN|nr:hypothetical protein [Micromonospora kangleipakensis]RZU75529.1 hypothetical protein EV384_4076 [Micromonospora kangleipakensis]
MRWLPVAVWWLFWSSAGVAAIAAPDQDRLITFSAAHGPGTLDLIGATALLVGALGPWSYLWRGRAVLRGSGKRVTACLTFALGLGVGLLLASVFGDVGAWWAVGTGLLTLVQAAAFAAIARDRATA